MEILRSLNGMIQIEITSADIAGTLTAIGDAGIPIYSTVSMGDLSVRLLIKRQDRKQLTGLLERRGDTARPVRHLGSFWVFHGLLKRPVLMLGILLLLVLSCVLPTRIWFFRVEGNETVPSKQILEQAQLCGIRFGASRREVRSEKMKNALLQAMPQLQWAGINTKGSVATISVSERQSMQNSDNSQGVSSIVASCDGLILSCTVTKGSAVCAVGQAVEKGQLLISGYTDCGLSIQACKAEGEVFARTAHSLTAVFPTEYQFRTEKSTSVKKYSLILGKKRINFYKDSGILVDSCDKMICEKRLTLPGGFVLPVMLVTETWEYYDQSQNNCCLHALPAFASDYLRSQMVAGEILSADEVVTDGDGIIVLEGSYNCREMIGRVQNEEIIKPNGND